MLNKKILSAILAAALMLSAACASAEEIAAVGDVPVSTDNNANNEQNEIPVRQENYENVENNVPLILSSEGHPAMPEVEQSVLDTDYDKFSMPLNKTGTFTSTTYSPIDEGDVLKFDIKPKTFTSIARDERPITIRLGTAEVIQIRPYRENRVEYTNNVNSELNTGISYAFSAAANECTKTYNIYITKNAGTLIFGVKNSEETAYTYFTVANAVNTEYNSIKLEWQAALETTNAYCYSPKNGHGLEVVQSVLDSDYDKADITSYFTRCKSSAYTQRGEDATSNPTYEGISDGNVIKFDWQPTVEQSKDNHWFGISLGTTENLSISEIAKKVSYTNSNNTELNKSLNYDFANDTETNYNIYIEKTNGNLVFGIKKSTESTYTWMKIDNAVNDNYTFIRMRTFGLTASVTNAYCYSPKLPMPEIAQSVLDSDYTNIDIVDTLKDVNTKTHTIAGTVSAFDGIKDGTVIKFDIKPGASTNKNQYAAIYFGNKDSIKSATESIQLRPYENIVRYYNKQVSTKDWNYGYNFANDGTTNYNVYIAKTNGTLVFGIKADSETKYTYFSFEDATNDNYTALGMGTMGFKLGLSNGYAYSLKDYTYSSVENNNGTYTFKIKRNTASAVGTGVFITAVYKKGTYPQLHNVAVTEQKDLTVGAEITFTNNVQVPSEEYEVKHFLWDNFTELNPVINDIQ